MIAVELSGVHILMGCVYFVYGARSTAQGLHAVLLRVGITSYVIFVLLAHIITYTEQ